METSTAPANVENDADRPDPDELSAEELVKALRGTQDVPSMVIVPLYAADNSRFVLTAMPFRHNDELCESFELVDKASGKSAFLMGAEASLLARDIRRWNHMAQNGQPVDQEEVEDRLDQFSGLCVNSMALNWAPPADFDWS